MRYRIGSMTGRASNGSASLTARVSTGNPPSVDKRRKLWGVDGGTKGVGQFCYRTSFLRESDTNDPKPSWTPVQPGLDRK